MTRRGRDRGFTLAELLVVIAIIGILASVAIFSVRTDKSAEGARHVQALLNEARRHAIAGGPVRADVAAATGITARSRVEFTVVSGASLVTLWDLVENPPPASTFTWVQQSVVALPRDVSIYAVRNVAQGQGDTMPMPPALVPPLSKFYYPNGSSDPFTVYLCKASKCADTSDSDRWRIYVLPVAGTAEVTKGWF